MGNHFRGNDLLELIKHLAGDQVNNRLVAVTGLITSIDTGKYMAKVMLQPYEIETGWLPFGTMYAGNGFGFVAMPDEGIEVTVVFELGDVNSGKILLCNFNDTDPPPALNPGEVILKHKSGTTIKIDADGNLSLSVSGSTTITSEDNVTVNAPLTIVNGNINLAGGGPAVSRVGDHVVGLDHSTLIGYLSTGSSKVTSG